jgi:hypothetical protein
MMYRRIQRGFSVERTNEHQSAQGTVIGRGVVLRVLVRVLPIFLGLMSTLLLAYAVASLASGYYAAHHANLQIIEPGEDLDLGLVVMFGMAIGFVASIPFGFLVYRYASKRIPKGICRQ